MNFINSCNGNNHAVLFCFLCLILHYTNSDVPKEKCSRKDERKDAPAHPPLFSESDSDLNTLQEEGNTNLLTGCNIHNLLLLSVCLCFISGFGFCSFIVLF